MPTVLNNLPSDTLYDPINGSEPQRNLEVVQSWDTVKALNNSLVAGAQIESLTKCQAIVAEATKFYETIQGLSIRMDSKSNAEHLQPVADGLRLFAKLAELE